MTQNVSNDERPASRAAGKAPIAAEPPDDATCVQCHYALRGLKQHRCPECGREFDPDDIETMLMPSWSGWLARHFLKRAGWWLYVWPVAAAILIVLIGNGFDRFTFGSESYAQFHLPVWLGIRWHYSELWPAAIWTWALLLYIWIVRACARRYVVIKYGLPIEYLFRDRRARRFTCVCFIAGFLLIAPSTDRCSHGEYWEVWHTFGIEHETGAVAEETFSSAHASHSIHVGGPWYLYMRRHHGF